MVVGNKARSNIPNREPHVQTIYSPTIAATYLQKNVKMLNA